MDLTVFICDTTFFVNEKMVEYFLFSSQKKLISLLIVILYHSQKTDNTCRCLLWNLMVNFFYWVFLQASFNFLLLCNLGSSWLIDECLLFLSNYILILHNVKIIWRVSIISLLICPHNYDRSTFHQILGSWGALFNGFQISLVWNSLPPTTFLFTKLVISLLIISLIYFILFLCFPFPQRRMVCGDMPVDFGKNSVLFQGYMDLVNFTKSYGMSLKNVEPQKLHSQCKFSSVYL